MRTLLIFDGDVESTWVSNVIKNKAEKIDLFPLTSRADVIRVVQDGLHTAKVSQTLINSSKHIDAETTVMQKNICEWSAVFGNKVVKGKTLKEWFLLPNKKVSTWWFGSISEKNTNQEVIFFKIVQINAIKKQISFNKYEKCFLSLSDRHQKKIIMRMLAEVNILCECVKNNKSYLALAINAKNAVESTLIWLKWIGYRIFIRYVMSPLKKRIPSHNPLLFVSFFPHFDASCAQKGEFRNKFFPAIQDKLQAQGVPITWLLMPVKYNQFDLKTSVYLAKKFSENGERILILYEFFTIKIFITGFYLWLRQIILSNILWFFLDKKSLFDQFTSKDVLPMIKKLWKNSFSGAAGVRGILYYLTYCEVFKKIHHVEKCFYYCEMHAWEKALNAAKRTVSHLVKTYAFQHAIVMRNLFNYFHAPKDTEQLNRAIDMPLSDYLIANGDWPYKLLLESKFPGLIKAEALRQLYLNSYLTRHRSKRERPLLLVAGSYDKTETKSLISMVFSAFPQAISFDIWFKGYPATPLKKLFLELNINVEEANYKIVFNDIAELLEVANIAFVPGSAVALEAVAFGCPVIVPVFSDMIQLNPLVDFVAQYFMISSAIELKKIVDEKIEKKVEYDLSYRNEMINQYWCLNPQLPLWEKILMTATTRGHQQFNGAF